MPAHVAHDELDDLRLGHAPVEELSDRLRHRPAVVAEQTLPQQPQPSFAPVVRFGLDPDPYGVVADLGLEHPDVVALRVETAATGQIEAATVPVAGDDAVADQAPYQGKPHVRTLVVGGVVGAVGEEQGDRSPIGRRNGQCLAIGQIATRGCADPSLVSRHVPSRPTAMLTHRTRIRIGRALARLPDIDAAFRDGILSYSKVRAITRVANRENEAMLLAMAGRSSAAELESLVRSHERVGTSDRERIPSEARRSLSWHYEDGMVVITAAVPAERGALVVEALRKVVDARTDERDAHYESLLTGDCARVAALSDAEPADARLVAEPTDSEPTGNERTNGTGEVVSAEGVELLNDAAAAEPALVADGPRRRFRGNGTPGCRRYGRRSRRRTRSAGAVCVRTVQHRATLCRRARGHRRALPGQRAESTTAARRPTLRGGAHHRPQRTRRTVGGGRCALPGRSGLGASTKRTPARSPAMPTSRSSSRMPRATC